VDDELTELLAELIVKVYELYLFIEEGEYKWYTCIMFGIHYG